MSDGDPAARPAEETDQARDGDAPSAETHTGDDASAERAEAEHTDADTDAAQAESADAAEGEQPEGDDAEPSAPAEDDAEVAEQESDDAAEPEDAAESEDAAEASGSDAEAEAEPDAEADAAEDAPADADADEGQSEADASAGASADSDEADAKPESPESTDVAEQEPAESQSDDTAAQEADSSEPDAEADAAEDASAEADAEPETTSADTDAPEETAEAPDDADEDAEDGDAADAQDSDAQAAEADEAGESSEPAEVEKTAVMAAASATTESADTDEAKADETASGEEDAAEDASDEAEAEGADEPVAAEPPTIQYKPVGADPKADPKTEQIDAVDVADADPKTVQIGAVAPDDAATPDDAAKPEDAAAADAAPDETPDDTSDSDTPTERRKPVLAAVGATVASLFVRARKTLGIAAAVLAALTGLYLIDLLVTQGEIPRNVVVAGVEIGGLEPIEAESVLRLRLSPRLDEPRTATADGKSIEIDPDAANVSIDWAATVDAANTPSYNPVTRALSLFTDREVNAVASGDTKAIGDTLNELAEDVDVAKVGGTVEYDGTTPVAVEPSEGKRLNIPRGVRDVITGWVERDVIPVPVDTLEVKATDKGVQRALDGFAQTAVSEPITLEARGRTLRMTPGEIASVVRFTANDDGSLSPRIPPKRLRKTMGKRLASTEVKGKDARIVFGAKKAKVKPSVDGTEVEWKATADALLKAAATTDEREINVTYHDTPAELTTKELKNLGIKEVIGKFTTYNFASDSGVNIKRVAEEVQGAIVRPGEVFSLNNHTGPRGIEQGYVGAAVIENGELTRAVGGGISQFATTLYNASYFAGMEDVEHREHSRYISRYPLAREATVFQNPDGSSVIDLKFRNTTPNGVAIQTSWTPTSITVKLWGTKKFKIESVTSEPFNYTAAPVVVKPYGTECIPQEGAQGYSATNTRIIRTLEGEPVERETRTVVYQPTEEIQCAPPPEPDPEPEPDGGPAEPPANGSPSTEPSKPSTSAKPSSNAPDDSGGLITDG